MSSIEDMSSVEDIRPLDTSRKGMWVIIHLLVSPAIINDEYHSPLFLGYYTLVCHNHTYLEGLSTHIYTGCSSYFKTFTCLF